MPMTMTRRTVGACLLLAVSVCAQQRVNVDPMGGMGMGGGVGMGGGAGQPEASLDETCMMVFDKNKDNRITLDEVAHCTARVLSPWTR